MSQTPRVQILDPILANQIAAGEVVERPASAAKELIENAIDAGATEVTVEVKDGGRKLLRVVDNGHGMTQADALLALERHATSKISVVDDLNRINTLGFRGEALPSISSVSRLTLTTRTAEQLMGTELRLEGGAQLKIAEAPARVGTEVRVEDLFFNVPARRKFLKSSATEAQLIQEGFQRVALCYPHVACRMIKDDAVSFDYPAHESLLERIEAMFGAHTAQNLQRVSAHGQLTLEGYISYPTHTYSAHRHSYTFINERFVKDRLFLGALQRAYGHRLPKGRYPFYLLKVSVHPSMVDVNVHPAKTEVRFANEEAVLDVLSKALRGAVTLMPEPGEEGEGEPWAIVPGGLSLSPPEPSLPTQEPPPSPEPSDVEPSDVESSPDDPLARHRALIKARLTGRVFEGERDDQPPQPDRRHHADARPSTRRSAGRHEVSYVSQEELQGGAPPSSAPPSQVSSELTSEPTSELISEPVKTPDRTPDLNSAIQQTLSAVQASAPLAQINHPPHTESHPAPVVLPPLSALTQQGALEALRTVGRADAWWVQEASDGLLLTHLPSVYAQRCLLSPKPRPTTTPLTLTLTPKQLATLSSRSLSELGVSVEGFGGQSARVTSLPEGFEEDWGGEAPALLEELLSCAVGDERVTWAQLLSQRPLSVSARVRALAWLSGEGRAWVERGEAPSCFVRLSWRELLRQRGGLPIF